MSTPGPGSQPRDDSDLFRGIASGYRLYATGRLWQTGVFTGLLGGTVGEQLVEVLAGALVLAQFLANRLGEYAHRRCNLVLLVIIAQEIDDFPVIFVER